MMENVETRLIDLIQRGKGLISKIRLNQDGHLFHWVESRDIADYQTWMFSATNLIRFIVPENNHYIIEIDKLLNHEDMKRGIPSAVVQKMHGILCSIKEEMSHDMLIKIEYIVAGATFDEFLDHASEYHKGNKKIESSVLASAVLEDTIKKIASKNGVTTAGLTLDPIIDDLVKNGVFTPVKCKRIKGFVGVRNHAFHAEWDKFDIRDVGELINGTRELIEKYM